MKKNQLQSTIRLYGGQDTRHYSLSKNAKKLLLITLILFSTTWAQALTYYLTAAGAGAAQTPANWNINPGGGGATPTNFLTGDNSFIIPAGINGIVSGNWIMGDIQNANNQNITLTIQGTLTINSGVTFTLQQKNSGTNTISVSGSLIFSGTSANQLIGTISGNGTAAANTITLLSGATLKTVNTSGIIAATGTSSINSTNLTPNLNTAANYEFNGAAQSTTGLPATVNNLTFSGTGSKTLVTPVQVNGIYSVENGSNVNTYIGTLTYGTNATLQYNSTGARAPGVEWVTPFTATGGVVIKNTGEITLATSKTVNLLTIAPSGKLTFNTNTLTVTTLNIQSDATGTGTYLGSGTLTATTTNVNLYLNAARRSWYMTSPVTGTAPSPLATSIIWYDETKGDPAGWTTSTTMTSGLGYMVTPNETTYTSVDFTGTLNDGPFPISLTRTTGKVKEGFNLIGNPYPSYFNIYKVFDADNLNGITQTEVDNLNILPTYWIRSKTSGSWGWDTYNIAGQAGTTNVSGLSLTNLIPPMQAFWVRVNTNAGASITFNNALREHKDVINNKFRAPSAVKAANQTLRLVVSNEINTDETILYFNANASNDYDMYDSQKMLNGSTSTVPDIYTTVGANQLVINGMSSIDYDAEIPLYFNVNASTSSTFAITNSELSNFEQGTQVWIKNNLTGISQLISDGMPYTFDIAETGANPKFNISFKAPGTTTEFANLNKINIFAFVNSNGQIAVKSKDLIAKGADIKIYNNIGQLITSKTLSGELTLLDKKLTSGVYIAVINNAGTKITERIIIK